MNGRVHITPFSMALMVLGWLSGSVRPHYQQIPGRIRLTAGVAVILTGESALGRIVRPDNQYCRPAATSGAAITQDRDQFSHGGSLPNSMFTPLYSEAWVV